MLQDSFDGGGGKLGADSPDHHEATAEELARLAETSLARARRLCAAIARLAAKVRRYEDAEARAERRFDRAWDRLVAKLAEGVVEPPRRAWSDSQDVVAERTIGGVRYTLVWGEAGYLLDPARPSVSLRMIRSTATKGVGE